MINKRGKFHRFGNWSRNVREWKQRADMIIRFEDLVANPIATIEKIRSVVDLPNRKNIDLPSFDQLKQGKANKIAKSVGVFNSEKEPQKLEQFFRRGVAGAWKDEMPDDLHELFWKRHKDMMIEFGYTEGMM